MHIRKLPVLLPTLIVSILLAGQNLLAKANCLLQDSSFSNYRVESPGPWEFRYGHKDGKSGHIRPKWKLEPRTKQAGGKSENYVEIAKRGNAAGAFLIGQRLVLPDSVAELDLALVYQTFCSGDGRSGIVDLRVYSPAAWDALPKTQEAANAKLDPADILSVTIHPQGEDMLQWKTGRIPSKVLTSQLSPWCGKEVVLAIYFETWHEGNEEWGRIKTFWLGTPFPYINAHQWPRFLYKGEEQILNVEAYSRDPQARFILNHRSLGAENWKQTVMKPGSSQRQYQGTIPAESVHGPLEVFAEIRSAEEGSQKTPIHAAKLTERPSHPNLFFSPAELQRMKEKTKEYDWAAEIYKGRKAQATIWLEKEFAPKVISGFWLHNYNCRDCGGGLVSQTQRKHLCRRCNKVWESDLLYHVYWSKIHDSYSRIAENLALVYQLSGEEKYARRAIEILTWYADHYAEFPVSDKGGKVVSQTLDECVWLLKMMNAADLAYAAMTPAERRHIERDLIYAGAMYTRKYRSGIHNIRCWHNSCWAAAGYFLGDPELIAHARDHKFGFVEQMKQGVLEDGMWYERSIGYHSYTVGAITYQLKAAMHNGDNLHLMPEVKKLLTFPAKIVFPNLVNPSLNDGGYSTGAISPVPIELAAAWYKDPVLYSILRKRYAMGARRNSLAAWQFGEKLETGVAFTPPPSQDLSGAGLAVLRAGTGEDALCAMLEYGEHGGGHGHPDKLQLIFYGLQRQLFPDLGTTGYANPLHPHYYKTTVGHNTVTIDGKNMKPASGKLLAFEDKKDYKAAVAQTDKAYPGCLLTRRILLTDNFLVDEFSVAGDKERQLDWFLRTGGKLQLDLETAPVKEKAISPPYGYLKNLQAKETGENWTGAWIFAKEPAGQLHITMKGNAGTQVVSCRAPGPARKGQQWGTLRVRRNARETRFLAVYQIVPDNGKKENVSFFPGTVRVGNTLVKIPEDNTQTPFLD